MEWKDVIKAQQYAKYVYDNYFLNDKGLQSFNFIKDLTQNEKALIIMFATIQDTLYFYHPSNCKEDFDPVGHVDDFLEIYFIQKYYGKGTTFPTTSELMHDAWALSRIVSIDTQTGMLGKPFSEANDPSSEPHEILTQTKFDEIIKSNNNKHLVKLAFVGNDNKEHTFIVQIRRLKQFVLFNELSKDEQVKDTVPFDTYFTLITKSRNIQGVQSGKVAYDLCKRVASFKVGGGRKRNVSKPGQKKPAARKPASQQKKGKQVNKKSQPKKIYNIIKK